MLTDKHHLRNKNGDTSLAVALLLISLLTASISFLGCDSRTESPVAAPTGTVQEVAAQDSQTAQPRPAPRSEEKREQGSVGAETQFREQTLHYGLLDISGNAKEPGGYAFLKVEGDASSAVANVYRHVVELAELLLNEVDGDGASWADLYDTLQTGDRFDFRTNGLECGYRFKVTSTFTAADDTRRFGIEYITQYGGRCGVLIDESTAATDVEFVWGVRPGIPGRGGIREMLRFEPSGQGTYWLVSGSAFVFEVPAGMEVIFEGLALLEHADDAAPDAPEYEVAMSDARTGSVLNIDPKAGKEIGRTTTSAAVDALFDELVESIRPYKIDSSTQ